MPLPAPGEKRHRTAGGRKSDGAFSAAVGKHEDQRKPDVFSGHRKVEEVSQSDGEGAHGPSVPLSGAAAPALPTLPRGASQAAVRGEPSGCAFSVQILIIAKTFSLFPD